MLHVNLLRLRNLIGSLSLDIGQYPEIEISPSEYRYSEPDGHLVMLIKIKKILAKSFIIIIFYIFVFGAFTCSIN